jgi:2'-5' RNA ligase
MRGSDAAVERLFLAVPLTEQARSRIIAELPPLPGRLVPPQNWHFTLRFLGGTEPGMRDALTAELRLAKLGGQFSIRFSGLGAFPRPRRARIIWLGVNGGAGQLTALAEAVESGVRRAGFPAEQRPFKPHLTLSRIEPTRPVTDVLGAQPAIDIEMPVKEIVLMRSELGAGPARYVVAERFPLER